ncbi:hypothetical protein B0H13DRAFT_1886358 [Mycena leptocephala]|nr:hypothetical protein B0H13DRAFT_1886358 [Mycena leptocephala]
MATTLFIANQDIPAYVELTFNYNPAQQEEWDWRKYREKSRSKQNKLKEAHWIWLGKLAADKPTSSHTYLAISLVGGQGKSIVPHAITGPNVLAHLSLAALEAGVKNSISCAQITRNRQINVPTDVLGLRVFAMYNFSKKVLFFLIAMVSWRFSLLGGRLLPANEDSPVAYYGTVDC